MVCPVKLASSTFYWSLPQYFLTAFIYTNVIQSGQLLSQYSGFLNHLNCLGICTQSFKKTWTKHENLVPRFDWQYSNQLETRHYLYCLCEGPLPQTGRHILVSQPQGSCNDTSSSNEHVQRNTGPLSSTEKLKTEAFWVLERLMSM